MKSDAAGFARYYQERVSRLQALRDGYVRLHLDLAPHGAGGVCWCGSRTAAKVSTWSAR